MCVKTNSTLISTVEYRKLPYGMKPSNGDLAETASMEYDSNAIIHMYSDLHSKRDESDLYFHSYDGLNKYPLIEAYFGKIKYLL